MSPRRRIQIERYPTLRRKGTGLLLSLALSCAALTSSPAAEVFVLSKDAGKSKISFFSKAPLETFEGKTNDVTGIITCDPSDLGEPVTAMIRVDLASLDSGMPLRDRHMRENHLHVEQYPEATFRLVKLAPGHPPSLEPGVSVKATVGGEFTLHGVTRQISVPMEIAYGHEKGAAYIHGTGTFDVKLSDYEIPRPKFLMMKLGETQRIAVEIWAEFTE